MILWIALFALILTNMMTYREVLELKSQIKPLPPVGPAMPIAAESVAKQFVQATNIQSTVTTQVEDVRYSPTEDAYQVEFAWTIQATGKKWYSSVRLNGDGFGNYSGKIASSQFNQPLGRTTSYRVSISSPSPLTGTP